jgi:hypothetical protein
MLFNSLLESILRPIQDKWRSKCYGVQLGSNKDDRLCNLRFADDLLLIASTKRQLKSMVEDLITAAASVGLEIHGDKTKILTNEHIKELREKTIKVGSVSIDVLPVDGTTKYLGRLLSLSNFHDVEVAHRIQLGWSKFYANKAELCGKHIKWSVRLKLFKRDCYPYGALRKLLLDDEFGAREIVKSNTKAYAPMDVWGEVRTGRVTSKRRQQ